MGAIGAIGGVLTGMTGAMMGMNLLTTGLGFASNMVNTVCNSVADLGKGMQKTGEKMGDAFSR